MRGVGRGASRRGGGWSPGRAAAHGGLRVVQVSVRFGLLCGVYCSCSAPLGSRLAGLIVPAVAAGRLAVRLIVSAIAAAQEGEGEAGRGGGKRRESAGQMGAVLKAERGAAQAAGTGAEGCRRREGSPVAAAVVATVATAAAGGK